MKKLNPQDKIFEGHFIRQDRKHWTSEGLQYYGGLYKDGGITYADVRTLILKFNNLDGDGYFGTTANGYTPVEQERKDFTSYTRVPIQEAADDAFGVFQEFFESIAKLSPQVMFHENPLEKYQKVNFTFWSEGGKHAFLIRGFANDPGWRKDTFSLERGIFKKVPTTKANGIARSGRSSDGRRFFCGESWPLSKKATLVDREHVTGLLYPFVKEKLTSMFLDPKK